MPCLPSEEVEVEVVDRGEDRGIMILCVKSLCVYFPKAIERGFIGVVALHLCFYYVKWVGQPPIRLPEYRRSQYACAKWNIPAGAPLRYRHSDRIFVYTEEDTVSYGISHYRAEHASSYET